MRREDRKEREEGPKMAEKRIIRKRCWKEGGQRERKKKEAKGRGGNEREGVKGRGG